MVNSQRFVSMRGGNSETEVMLMLNERRVVWFTYNHYSISSSFEEAVSTLRDSAVILDGAIPFSAK